MDVYANNHVGTNADRLCHDTRSHLGYANLYAQIRQLLLLVIQVIMFYRFYLPKRDPVKLLYYAMYSIYGDVELCFSFDLFGGQAVVLGQYPEDFIFG